MVMHPSWVQKFAHVTLAEAQTWHVAATVAPHNCETGGAGAAAAAPTAARACCGAAQSSPCVQASVWPQPMNVQSAPADWQPGPTV